MKKAMIIIRPNMYAKTKEALCKAGFSAYSAAGVYGRGKAAVDFDYSISNTVEDRNYGSYHRFMPKTMLIVYARDEDEGKLVRTVIDTNRTNNPGDGKIFILPVSESIRVRTGETNDETLV